MNRISSGMLIAMLFTAAMITCSFSAPVPVIKKTQHPVFQTEVIAFEDNFLFGTPDAGSLVYRVEGRSDLINRMADHRLTIAGGPVSYIHPAQYDRPTLRVKLRVLSGEPGIAVCHNGMRDNAGHPNPSPGVEIVLRQKDTAVRNLKTGKIIAIIPEAFPRNREAVISIAWDFDSRGLRVDLPNSSYSMRLPDDVIQKGGFALHSPASPNTSYLVSQIQVLWLDQRDVVIYDGHDTIYDLHGKKIGTLPPVKLPDGLTNYSTAAVDLHRERTLILMGGPDLYCAYENTFKGWAVRDLETGKLDIISRTSKINGCLPIQGGGGMDGFYMMQSWNYPASTCWIDWNAYDKGDREGFVKPAMQGRNDLNDILGFHDPGNALDGSMCRYLKITGTTRGVNHLTVHPNLMPYAPFSDISMLPPKDPKVSHTGPGGIPTQLAVRDRERAWYEEWAFLGNSLHTQNLGYNVFARKDDWEGPQYPSEKNAPPFKDYANMVPSLLHPGWLLAPMYRFSSDAQGVIKCEMLAVYWLKFVDGHYVIKVKLAPLPDPGLPVFQILLDSRKLFPAAGSVSGKRKML